MIDTEVRGLVLQRYYERRRESWFLPKPDEFDVPLTNEDILAICDQLAEHGLLEWKSLKSHGLVHTGMGKISAFGIDVVEGSATPDIKVEFVANKNITISGSQNVVVGDNNVQSVAENISALVQLIDSANATPEQKQEARSLLRKFLEHPLVAALAGGAVGLLGG